MTLDPEILPIMELLKSVPPLRTTPVAELRASELEFEKLIPQAPEPVKSVEDGEVKGREHRIPVRTYSPSEEPVGTIVFYHGGGFVLGSIELYDRLCRQLVNASGCRVVSVGYRLAPEHKFPKAVVDSYDAFEWALDTIGGRVAVAGDSAGGNLAAVVAQLAKKNGVAGPHYQALIYPVLNQSGVERSFVDFAEGYLLTLDDALWFGEQYLSGPNDASNVMASPMLSTDLSGLPPAIVVTAEYDPLRDQGEVYTARLRKAGVSVIGLRYTGMIHGFMSFPLKVALSAMHDVGFAIRNGLS